MASPLPEVDPGRVQHGDRFFEPAGGVQRPGQFDGDVVAAARVRRDHPQRLHRVRRTSLGEQQPREVPVEGLVRRPSRDRLPEAALGLRRPVRDLPVNHPERPVGGREARVERRRRLPGRGRLLEAAESGQQVAEEEAGGRRRRKMLRRGAQHR